tara:strand:- start:2120 stop:2317 length:198 start_codon:yes stop_codon:yes gene_type:complete
MKELKVMQGPYGFYIKYEGGGQLPDMLSGFYTGIKEANDAVKAYKEIKKVRKPTDGYSKIKHRKE